MAGDDARRESFPNTLQQLARDLAAAGEAEALLYVAREEAHSWSFDRLAEQVEMLARGLSDRGVRSGDPVGLCAGNSPQWIIACLAVLRCGATVVPIDTQSAEETFRHIVKDSGLSLLFASSAVAERLEGVLQETEIGCFLLDDDEEDRRSWRQLLRHGEPSFDDIEADDRAVLFYTSGTTGPPKGVPLSHRNLCYQVRTLAEAKLIRGNERVLLPLPLHHVYPFVIGLLTPLALRLPVVLPSGFTGTQIVAAIRQGRSTMIIAVPRLYDGLVSGIEARLRKQGRLRSGPVRLLLRLSATLNRRLRLRLGKSLLKPLHARIGPDLDSLVSGGAALKPDLAWSLESLGWKVGTGYGLTETSPLLTYNPPGARRFDNAGRPMPGVELRIDRDALEGVADKHLGEVVVRGPGVFSGYHNLPDKTAEALSEDGWFRTGDLGYLDDGGYLHLAGRRSTMIVAESGENIDPEKVEEAYQAHPAIAEVAVLERNGRLVGLIVPEAEVLRGDDAKRAIDNAVREVGRRLPSHNRLGEFVLTSESIPRTRLGKPRRHLLTDRYERSLRGEDSKEAPRRAPIAIEEMSAEDQSLLEEPAARAAWSLLCERFADRRLTPNSDLQLDLGIDSIDWLNLTFEISERTGVTLSEEAIGEMQAVRDLLAELAAGGAGEARRPAPLDDPEAALDKRQQRWLQGQGAVAQATGRALFLLNRLIMRSAFRLHKAGGERMPQAPFVLVPNHTSYLDPFALAGSLDYGLLRNTFWAGWTGILFGDPLRRLFARLTQVVPIAPERATASSLAFGAVALKRGRNLVWFPEGQRSPDGTLQPFKAGIGALLDRHRVPVVPVAIEGTYEAWPTRRSLPRLRPLKVRIGPPLDPTELEHQGQGETPAQRITDALHDRLRQLLEQG